MEQITCFNDFYELTKTLTACDKGSLFEKFSLHLFQLDLRLNQHLESIWLYSDIPANILKELNLPSKDKGIDLLAKIDSDYYAIQCKFRQNPEITVKWNELATFFGLSFGINNKIKGGFFVTNTFNLCDEVKKTEKVFTIYGSYFDELPSIFFKNLRMSLTNQNKKVYVSKTPRFYQDMCKYATCLSLIKEDRCHIEMACGTGKTLISYWIFHGLAFNRTVIFVPSLYLLSQFYSDWVNQSHADYQSYICPYFEQLGMRKRKLNFLLVGSDADVDNDVEQKSNGLVMHTDPKEIRKYINTHLNDLVVLCTYQSSDKLAQACEKKIIFDFAIFDEAHKTVGQGRVGNKFTLMLNNDHLIIRKRLFMTATPKIYRGDVENPEVISMSNPAIYGEKCYVYNTGNAIEEGILTDYQVLAIYARNADIERSIKEKKLVKYKKAFDNMEANYLAIILMILKEFNSGVINHLITYHNRVASSETFAEYLRIINKELYGTDIFVEHLDGSVSMSKRKKLIKSFSDAKKGILCSARVLNEGVNIPCINAICFVDCRNSTIDIVQCVGRALRLYPEKMLSYVLVPVFVDEFTEDGKSFGDVCRILKALKSTDKTIVEYFSLRAKGVKPKKKKINMKNYHADEIDYSEMIDLDEWCESVESCVWRSVDTFEARLEELRQFVEENNRLPSSKNAVEKSLGIFCGHHRTKKKRGILSDYRISKLNDINLWYWELDLDALFNEKYEALKEWVHSNNRIPSNKSTDQVEKSLGGFASNLRAEKKNNTLEKKRVEMLENLDHWYWTDESKKSDTRSFNDKCKDVAEFVKINGRLPSHTKKNAYEKKLGKFCQRQRSNKTNLSPDKIEMLESIDLWTFDSPFDTQFDSKFNELVEFVNVHNKLPTQHSKDKTEHLLAVFCCNQRQKKKNGKLDSNKVQKFEQLNGWLWDLDDVFYRNVDMLKQFIAKNKRLPNKRSTISSEKMLGSFCSNCRNNKNKNKLSEEKIAMLENIEGFYWSYDFNGIFDQKIEKVKLWVETNGRLPSENAEDKCERELGQFCGIQRKNKRKNILSEERIKKCITVPMWYWTDENLTRDNRPLDEKIKELSEWISVNKRMPSVGAGDVIEKKMGQFCGECRRKYKNQQLLKKHIDVLEGIQYWYWQRKKN